MRLLFTCILAFLTFSFVRAADNGRGLASRIEKAHEVGQRFVPFSIMIPTQAPVHTEILKQETLFRPDAAVITRLFQSHPEAISLKFRTEIGKEYELEMLESHPLASKVDFGKIDASGRHAINEFDPGVHYQGTVAGSKKSMAALSVFADGSVMLLFSNEAGNFNLGRVEDGSGNYILYNDRDILKRPAIPCGTKDEEGGQQSPIDNGKTTSSVACNRVGIYWEVAYDLYTNKGSSYSATQSYATALFNQMQAMYANENIVLELKGLYIWVTQDDMPTTSSSDGLFWMLNAWNARGNAYGADLAHVLTCTNKGNGGKGFLNVLCSRATSYAYSDLVGSFNSIPTFSWDVEVVTHETGHNLGSHHTHWCGWMTGAGRTCGAIDNCYTIETASGCSTCSSIYQDSAPVTSWTGSVMSYCHLVDRGIDLANGFGTLPGDDIRSRISGAACLNKLVSANLTDTSICNADGSIAIDFKSDNYGTAPYTFSWSNGALTQNLSNLSQAGKYSVQIVDAKGCSTNYAVDLIRYPSPGMGIVPEIEMPVCCLNTGLPLELNATPPQSLTACQSVCWLRSKVQPASYQMAAAIFDSTLATNKFSSSNQNQISATTGAQLNIQVPVSCTETTTDYYTPIVVNMPRAAHNITTSSTSVANIYSFSTVIGQSTTLPDETSIPSACDRLDTPSSQTLVVTVTGYTGRTGQMSLAIVEMATGRMMYEATGLSGNGTYTVQGYELAGNILGDLKVFVFDRNCSAGTCTACAVNVSVTRKIVYPMHPASMSVACTIGNPIKVEFAPNACTKLDASSLNSGLKKARLHPNPASQEAYLEYQVAGRESVRVQVMDLLGRVVWMKTTTDASGSHRMAIPVSQLAKGVYNVQIQAGAAEKQALRLIVE